MISRRHLFVAALAAAPAFAAAKATAQGQAIVGLSTTTAYSVEGRITAVDPASRTVTLTMTDGSTLTAKVSQAVANLGSTKVGDTVVVGMEDKRTFVLSGPNTKTPSDRSTSVTAVGRMGNTSGAVAADKSITTWWVTAVDVAGNKISLVDPAGGQVRTFPVDGTAQRANLSRVKPGDNLTLISSEIVAVGLTQKR
jgi:hypothetical protein